ncbi:hypothetical protein DYB31_001031, partial [Aphanomyces astaci]
VDRGSCSVEICAIVLAYQSLFPDAVHVNRGNHEDEFMNSVHSFRQEVLVKYDADMFDAFNALFNALPLAHVVNRSIFVVHGGLSDAPLTLAQVPLGLATSRRGAGVVFGPDVCAAFLRLNQLKMVVRSHEVIREGFMWTFDVDEVTADGRVPEVPPSHVPLDMGDVPENMLLTLFSCSNYCHDSNRTSVGYGDYAPVTYAGRGFLTFSGILGGLLILSLVQSIFFGALELTDNESRVKYIIDKSRWDCQRREAAAKLIQTQFRLKKQQQQHGTNPRLVEALTLHLFECMEHMHKFVRGEPRNVRTFEEEMDAHIGGLLRDMDDMQRQEDAVLARIQDKIRRLNAACDCILSSQAS